MRILDWSKLSERERRAALARPTQESRADITKVALEVIHTVRAQGDEALRAYTERFDGVQQVKESKYIMLHAPRSALPEIRRLLPGSEYPTIIPLEGSTDKVAIHAVCRENVFWETLESLKKAGASALLVLPVEKMLA